MSSTASGLDNLPEVGQGNIVQHIGWAPAKPYCSALCPPSALCLCYNTARALFSNVFIGSTRGRYVDTESDQGTVYLRFHAGVESLIHWIEAAGESLTSLTLGYVEERFHPEDFQAFLPLLEQKFLCL